MPKNNNSKYWFGAKRFGWGWGLPVRWQGWLVIFIYAIFLVPGVYLIISNNDGSWPGILYLLGYIAVLDICLI